MHQLKKYGAIGGAIALVVCWPLAVGQIGKNVINDSIGNMSSDVLKAEVVRYERGYLSSDVQTRYTILDPEFVRQLESDDLPTEIIVNSHVSHGILSLKAVSTLDNLEQLPLTLTTVTQLNGNTDYTLDLDNWHQSTQGDEGVMVSVTPSILKGHVSVLGEVSFDLDIPSVEIDFVGGEKMLLSGMSGTGLGRKQNSFWLGEQEINMAEMSILDAQQNTMLAIKNGQYLLSSSIDETSQRLHSQHVSTVEQIVMPQGTANDVVVDFELGDLDSVSFENILEVYQGSSKLGPEESEKVIPFVETLIEKGFYLSLNKMAVNFGNDSEFEGQIKVTLPEGTNSVMQNPMAMLQNLTGDLGASFSGGLVEQYPFIKQGVEDAVMMKFASKTDKGYQIQAQLKEGNLVFESGQKIPLMAILFGAVMQR
ncbi:DUF945 family protein [Vibrio ostreicida]|uniref:DUF945 family protein n=1 Tax=Vibrio ostreicida TaxID=526588 RepID=UPI003B5966C6